MKAKLTRVENKTYYFDENGDRHDGVPVGIRGDLAGIRGDLTGITGDLDDCEITEGDRLRGINIVELIGK